MDNYYYIILLVYGAEDRNQINDDLNYFLLNYRLKKQSKFVLFFFSQF